MKVVQPLQVQRDLCDWARLSETRITPLVKTSVKTLMSMLFTVYYTTDMIKLYYININMNKIKTEE